MQMPITPTNRMADIMKARTMVVNIKMNITMTSTMIRVLQLLVSNLTMGKADTLPRANVVVILRRILRLSAISL
jgi:hypothetical protein